MGRMASRDPHTTTSGGVAMSASLILATVALGAAGAVVRWWVNSALSAHRNWTATLVVNIVGSAIAGGVGAVATGEAALPLIAGLCGGVTTFSTLAVQLLPATTRISVARLVALALAHALGGIGACAASYLAIGQLFL